ALLLVVLDHPRCELVLRIGTRGVADHALLVAQLLLKQKGILPAERSRARAGFAGLGRAGLGLAGLGLSLFLHAPGSFGWGGRLDLGCWDWGARLDRTSIGPHGHRPAQPAFNTGHRARAPSSGVQLGHPTTPTQIA